MSQIYHQRPPRSVGTVGKALILEPDVKAGLGQEFVQLTVEDVSRRSGQPIRRDEQFLLLLRLPLAQGHRAASVIRLEKSPAAI